VSREVGTNGNSFAYVKGVDFNAKQKYDYNILNGQGPPGRNGINKQMPLSQAGSQIMLQ